MGYRLSKTDRLMRSVLGASETSRKAKVQLFKLSIVSF